MNYSSLPLLKIIKYFSVPRPKTIRKIAGIPTISGFKPYGLSANVKRSEALFLLYEEYEALRLCDYEKYNQLDASSLMGVSRPTLTRIYMSAREKVAIAMVEGRKIIIEGGKVSLDSEWFHCSSCGCYFNKIDESVPVERCTLCGSSDIHCCNNEDGTLTTVGGNMYTYRGGGRCQGQGGGRRRRCCGEED